MPAPTKAQLVAENAALKARLAELERIDRGAAEPAASFHLAAVLAHAPIVIWAVDLHGTFTLSQGLGLHGLGLAHDAVVGRSIFEMYAESPVIVQAVKAALAGQESTGIVEVGERAFESWYGPLHDATGRTIGATGVATDVTERRRAEQGLRRSENRFRALIEHSSDAISLISAEGVTLYTSPAASRISGMPQNEALGRNAFEQVHADDVERIQQLFSQLLAEPGRNVSAEFRIRHKDGRWLWMEGIGANLLAEPSVEAVVTNYRDITLRKQAEEALQRAHDVLETRVIERTAELEDMNASLRAEIVHRVRAEERSNEQTRILQSILSSMADGVVVADENGELLLINPAGARIIGVDPDRAAEQDWRRESCAYMPDGSTPYPPDQRPLRRAVRGESVDNEEILLRLPNSPSGVWIQVNARPLIDSAGLLRGGVVVFHDVTERKHAEAQLRAEQRFLRRLIRAHERDRQLMAYEIHDGLVQYMSGALLHLEGMAHDEPKLSAKSKGAYELARHLLRRSIDEGRRVMSGLRPPILDEEGIVRAIEYLIAEREIPGRLAISFEHKVSFSHLEPLLEGTIFRIVQETLTNIQRHSQATRAKVSLREEGEWIVVEVWDNGVGFEPQGVTEDRFGLEGIRKRAALMEGRAHVESQPGQGTVIKVELPRMVAAGAIA